MAEKISIHKRNVEARLKSLKDWKTAEENKENINYLLSKGYKEAEYKSLVTNKKEKFLLQPRHNESLTHLFVVYDTAEYLEKKGYKVQKYTTKKPDIVFNINNKKYAIEVEIGSMLNQKKLFNEKLKLLNANYDEWFFVITDRNLTKKYQEFGKSVGLRYLKLAISKLSSTKIEKSVDIIHLCWATDLD
jgi:hypothetical protein